ncbi:hypothetical protein Hanom_Chr15g01362451 [Helianthus anomalus]
MIGENINQYTRFYPKDLSFHGIPTDCPQPLGRMLECSELTFGLLGRICYLLFSRSTRPKRLPVIVSLHALSVQQVNVFEVYIKHILSS